MYGVRLVGKLNRRFNQYIVIADFRAEGSYFLYTRVWFLIIIFNFDNDYCIFLILNKFCECIIEIVVNGCVWMIYILLT